MSQPSGGLLALGPSLVVGRIGQAPSLACVADDDGLARREGHGLPGEGTAVDEQGVTLLAGDGDELVHQAALGAGEFVLGPLAEASQRQLGQVQIKKVVGSGGHGNLDGGRRAEPGTDGHISGIDQVEPPQGGTAGGPGVAVERGQHAAHIVAPTLIRVGRQPIEGEVGLLALAQAESQGAHLPLRAPRWGASLP
jgi:hypothetical protein